ncbi:MAG: exopolysaccharide biosynthesis polyprenyl glycosylphosphotransferase [Candidatus Muirbacterium halophilum]|nr:exopolysaccharide biosynthesis polyprenyl glycosylphosphotransferase [Candidatus Muirbacterium halophilum]MCK9476385.1 exopolysaccharide biosynthesis polyprenyl glycosylphosphotransferase [Candidatus Muirbacterium halophilum]
MRRYFFRLFLLLSDAVAFFTAFYIVYFAFNYFYPEFKYSNNLLFVDLVIFIIIMMIEETYSLREEDLIKKSYYIMKGVFFTYVISFLFLYNLSQYSLKQKYILIGNTTLWFFLLFFIVLLMRYITERFCVNNNVYFRKTLLIISDNDDKKVFRQIFNKGYAKANRIKKTVKHKDVMSLSEEDITVLLKENEINQVIIFSKNLSLSELIFLQRKFEGRVYFIKIIPEMTFLKLAELEVIEINNFLVLENRQNLLSPYRNLIKRLFDIFGSIIGIIILSPVFIFIIIAIKLTSKGPVFYAHKRLGKNKKIFGCWKFRTMVLNADKILEEWLEKNPEIREEFYKDFKLKDDPRITSIGNFLRKTSLDEFPQLWNVIKGEMSLVGPRPIVEKEVFKYKEWSDMLFRVKPGITGMWQASGRNDIEYDDRVELDMYYIKNWSLWLDIVIIIKTIIAVFMKKGAY